MYDFMLNNSIYLVLVILMVGFAGILIYLVRMNSALRRLENREE